MKVRLKKDLTKYHPSLRVGVEGDAIGPYGPNSRNNPKAFVGVRFQDITLDVLLRDLERVMEKKEEPRLGPQLQVQSVKPPKKGQVVEFAGIEFQVQGIADRLDVDLWLVDLAPL